MAEIVQTNRHTHKPSTLTLLCMRQGLIRDDNTIALPGYKTEICVQVLQCTEPQTNLTLLLVSCMPTRDSNNSNMPNSPYFILWGYDHA